MDWTLTVCPHCRVREGVPLVRVDAVLMTYQCLRCREYWTVLTAKHVQVINGVRVIDMGD